MRKTVLALWMTSMLCGVAAHASQVAITSANNQAFVDAQLGYNKLIYGTNHPADAGAPLFNAHVPNAGFQAGLHKTFGNIYSAFILSATKGAVNYADSGLDSGPYLNNGSLTTLSLAARLGYSFYFREQAGFTPYLLFGFANTSLNTGGYTGNFAATSFNGATLITQSFYYGIGLLNQWAVTPAWVLGADLQFASPWNANTTGYVNNFNNQAGASTTLQSWRLSSHPSWRAGLTSDYRATDHLHVRAGIAYGATGLGGANTANSGIYPSQAQQYWSGNIGLGYSLADDSVAAVASALQGNQAAIQAVNNQASLQVSYLNQVFQGGTTAYQYSQSKSMPRVGVALSKTWRALYAQLNVNEGIAINSYQSQNTTLNASGKLGYQFMPGKATAITPYATMGYHRTLQNQRGIPSNTGIFSDITETYYINGITETYQHSWYGLGALLQWSFTPLWVVSADVNAGKNFNASLQNWLPGNLPQNATYTLGNAWYQMVSLGVDYAFAKNWHAEANVDYWHYTYGASSINALGVATLADSFHQVGAGVAIGYAFA